MTKAIANAPRTEWFPSSVKPAREGIYQTIDYRGARWYNYWNGRSWCYGARHVPDVKTYRAERAEDQDRKWRGLASDPNA